MLPSMIQTHFLDRIANTHGQPPKDTDWATDLSLKLEGVEARQDQLNRAADALVTTIRSKSFPSFAVCLQAIRKECERAPYEAVHTGAGITRENYTEHVRKWKGKFAPEYLVITRDQVAQWETWRAYYERKGFKFDYEALSNPARQNWTVPTMWPDQFDREAPLPMTDDEARRARQPAGQFRADGAIERVRDSMEDFRRDIPRRRREERVKRQHIDETAFERWAEDAKSQPTPSPSSELIQRMNPETRKDAA